MIEILDVSKQFKNETVIDYRDMVFESGKAYMLLGASGCGKSTLLNMIDGEDMSQKSQKEKDHFRIAKIGYIFQDFKLISEMSVMDNINILRLEGVDTSGAALLLKELGIYDQRNKKIKHLSGGQKQRVAIVRALVKKPDIILADEPTGNLNFAIGEQVMAQLTAVAKGKTLIAVTHDERLSKYFDAVIDMNEMTFSRRDSDGGKEAI